MQKTARSFTLIEVLIIIVILGVLSLLLGLTTVEQLKKARDARRKVDLAIVARSLEQYFDSTTCFPAKLPACGKTLDSSMNTFITNFPCDPLSRGQYRYVSDGSDCSASFQLYTKLERSSDPAIILAGCQYGCGPDCEYNYGVSSTNKPLEYCIPTATPTPTPIQYVCAPGGGQTGSCEAFEVPSLSECPEVYPDDPTCQNECRTPANRCKNSKGKYKPTP